MFISRVVLSVFVCLFVCFLVYFFPNVGNTNYITHGVNTERRSSHKQQIKKNRHLGDERLRRPNQVPDFTDKLLLYFKLIRQHWSQPAKLRDKRRQNIGLCFRIV